MNKKMTIEELANAYMDRFAETGLPYYFMIYRSLKRLAEDAYNIEKTDIKEQVDRKEQNDGYTL